MAVMTLPTAEVGEAPPSVPRALGNDAVRVVARRLGVVAFVALLCYLVVLPVVRLQATAFEDGAAGYDRAFGLPRIGQILWNTVGLAFGSLVIAMVLGTALAWAANRLPRRLAVLQILPILPIVIPAVAAIVGWAFLLSPRPGYLNAMLRNLPWWSHLEEGPIDIYSIQWIVIITGFSLSSFVYMFVRSGFENINSEMIEAAQVSGMPEWKVFFKITLPLLRPTLIYGAGVALLLGLGQFTGPLLLGTNTGVSVLTTEMYFQISDSPAQFATAAALGSPLLIVGIVVVFAQKAMLGNQRRFVTHGGKAFRSQGRPSKTGVAIILLFSLLSTVLPLLALVFVALSRYWSGTVNFSALTFENFETIFSGTAVPAAVGNSVMFSLIAMAIVLPLGFVAANLIVRGTKYPVLRVVTDVLVSMPLGVPAVIFGAAFLLTYTQGPIVLYGTSWVVILVYVTLMLPFATRMQLSSMLALGETYLEASRVSGAGFVATNVKILLPLMRGSLGGTAALLFVLLTHEFTASLLVRASQTQVMGTILFEYWSNGGYPLVAAVALVMTGVTAVGVAAAMLVGGTDALSKM
ncbi:MULTISPECIES: ABC transporter permease [Rhodococcus]|uniref:ABC transporter permease n=1 Tax=Rhodococcus TaxID=1827 RepID=UPI000E71A246|nr:MULTISPECIES: iron ABC transporter permease [Rhodococcus]QHG83722.1 iron ABC transporter permease [Rhodococcus rhodochrous]QOH56592.1 iron ABC transporter permease [Rhodococcus rhodochrous]WAL48627.1 iron ABC transporter permease [Rhodococcus pyridinivorans]